MKNKIKSFVGIIFSIAIGLATYPIMQWVITLCNGLGNGNSLSGIFFKAFAVFIPLIAVGLFPIIYIGISYGIAYLLHKVININLLIIIIFMFLSIFIGYFIAQYQINANIKDALVEGGVAMIWPFIVCVIGGCSTGFTTIRATTFNWSDNYSTTTYTDEKGKKTKINHWKF